MGNVCHLFRNNVEVQKFTLSDELAGRRLCDSLNDLETGGGWTYTWDGGEESAKNAAGLQAVHIQISVSGDGVDSDSTVDFKVLYQNSGNAAGYHLASTKVGKYDNFERDLTVYDDLTESQVLNSTFYLEINANRRDHFEGDLTVTFKFKNGDTKLFPYGSFAIGTYHESNSTRKTIVFA